MLCHSFRRDHDPACFLTPSRGPQSQPKKDAARATIERNHFLYEIANELKELGTPLSATAVAKALRELGFAPLPRRRDEERPELPRPTVKRVADVRAFQPVPRRFTSRCGGLFLLPDLVCLGLEQAAKLA